MATGDFPKDYKAEWAMTPTDAPLDRRLAAPANCAACRWDGHVGEVKNNWTCPKCGSPVWLAEWDHPTHPTKQ